MPRGEGGQAVALPGHVHSAMVPTYILAPPLISLASWAGRACTQRAWLNQARPSQPLPTSRLPLPALVPSRLPPASSPNTVACHSRLLLSGSNLFSHFPLSFTVAPTNLPLSSFQAFAQALPSAKNALHSTHCVSKSLPSQICLPHQPFALNIFHRTHGYALITAPNISEPAFLCAKRL